MLLHDLPEGRNKIQDNYKNELFVMESQHQDPNVYIIKPLNGKGPMHTVNQWQLFDLQKTQGVIHHLVQPQTPFYLPY